jgi:hypothetical protein
MRSNFLSVVVVGAIVFLFGTLSGCPFGPAAAQLSPSATAPPLRMWTGPADATPAQALEALQTGSVRVEPLTELPARSLFGDDPRQTAWLVSGAAGKSVWLQWSLDASEQPLALHAKYPGFSTATVWYGSNTLVAAGLTHMNRSRARFALPASERPRMALMQLKSELPWRSTVRLEPIALTATDLRLHRLALTSVLLYLLSAIYAMIVGLRYGDRLHGLYALFCLLMIPNGFVSYGALGSANFSAQGMYGVHVLAHSWACLLVVLLAIEAFSVRQRLPAIAPALTRVTWALICAMPVFAVLLPNGNMFMLMHGVGNCASAVALALLIHALGVAQWRGVITLWFLGFLPLALQSLSYYLVHVGHLPAEGWVAEWVPLSGFLDVLFNSAGLAFYLKALRARRSQTVAAIARRAEPDAAALSVHIERTTVALRRVQVSQLGLAMLVIRPIDADWPKTRLLAATEDIERAKIMHIKTQRVIAAIIDAVAPTVRWGDVLTRINRNDFALLLPSPIDAKQALDVFERVRRAFDEARTSDSALSSVSLSMAYAVVTANSPAHLAEEWLEKLRGLLDASNDQSGGSVLCLHDGLAFGEAGIRLTQNVGEARAIAARTIQSSANAPPLRPLRRIE